MAPLDRFRDFAAAFVLVVLAPPALAQGDDSESAAQNEPSFQFTVPDTAMAFPNLAQQFEAERANARIAFDERLAEQAEIAAEFPDYPSPPLIYHESWGIAGRSGRLMSLAASVYRYDGGAHGNSEFGARLWDTEGDHGIDLPYLFDDRYAAYSILDADYCGQLRAMQAERGVETDEEGFWSRCPLLHEQTLFPAGEEGGPFTHIAVRIAPYVAGPYVAGEFEVDVPVTQGLLDLLRPEYRDAFALPRG